MRCDHYFLVLSMGPLIMVRVGMEGKPGRRKHVSRWRDLMRGLTPVMKSHGMRSKDISGVNGLYHPDEFEWADKWRREMPRTARELESMAEQARTLEKLERAYAGDASVFADFWLYEWRPAEGRFELIRKGGG